MFRFTFHIINGVQHKQPNKVAQELITREAANHYARLSKHSAQLALFGELVNSNTILCFFIFKDSQ